MAEIEGIFGRHFQSPYVRGQLFLQIFVWFFVAESLLEWVFSILKQQDRNEAAFIFLHIVDLPADFFHCV